MPYGNSDKLSDWFWYCIGVSGVVLVVTAAIIGLTRNDTREFMDGYRQGQKEWYGKGYTEGYKKAHDDAVAFVERKISEIENRLSDR